MRARTFCLCGVALIECARDIRVCYGHRPAFCRLTVLMALCDVIIVLHIMREMAVAVRRYDSGDDDAGVVSFELVLYHGYLR